MEAVPFAQLNCQFNVGTREDCVRMIMRAERCCVMMLLDEKNRIVLAVDGRQEHVGALRRKGASIKRRMPSGVDDS